MMGKQFDLVVEKGRCFTPEGQVEIDVGVHEGRIVGIGDFGQADAAERIDATGLDVLPGVIDTQVHFREPGLAHKEDLESGTKAAVLGGVTAVFEMPNTSPLTTTPEALQEKLDLANGRAWCNYAFFVGATPENAEDLPALESLPGCAGVKMFMGSSTGSLLVSEDRDVGRVLTHGRRRMAVHSEDEARLVARQAVIEDGGSAHQHPVWRDAESARLATERLLGLAKSAGRRIHVLHITTAEEMDMLAAAKDFATVEVTPQHLTLAAPDCYDRLGSYAQMNPPIRDVHHREALWRAVASGIVDVIGSDHAPHTREEKERPYPASPSGMPGVQTLVPVMLDHVSAGRLSLARFVDLTSSGSQRIYGIAGKGRIAVGYDADFTVVDLKASRTIENSKMATKSGWTPFDGMKVSGWPVATIVGGRLVMQEDEVLGQASGAPVRFTETLSTNGT
jgi:dihydroorotase